MNKRIKELREYLGMSRTAFGEKLGISGDVVNNLERGRVEIKEDRIKLICSVFGVNEKWLRYGKGDMFIEEDEEFSYICGKIGANDEKAKRAIMNYWQLSPSDRKLFWHFIEAIVEEKEED